ncbi:MAG: hypothetical protein JETCAE03_32880 [Ignavibacteriaceae bacterium]|nr:MAG: hypothetical protein JETCAE03_32880 [Ignavibacteriaceae bacterium]
MKNELQQYIDHKTVYCVGCRLHELHVNDNTYYYKGLGKLLSKPGKISNEIFVVGLNPSHVRWPGLMYSFGGGYATNCKQDQDNAGWKFFQILAKLNVLDRCYITNVAKCSTEDNTISEEYLEECYKQVLSVEIEYHSPKLILALGRQTSDFLNKYSDIKNVYLPHPSYYFSYQKGNVQEYEEQIKKVLTEYKFYGQD